MGQRPGPGRLALAGVAWGIALLVKFTALLLVPVFVTLLAWRRVRRWRLALAEIALLGAVALLVVNAGMGFRGSFTPLGDFEMASDFGRSLKSWLPASTPVPLPRAYWSGFDAQKRDVERGEFPFYLRGEWSREGWWYYEALSLLVKTPLPFVPMLLACPFVLWRRRAPARQVAFLWLPMLVLGFLLTALFAARGRFATGLGAAVVCWYAATAVWVHPGHLAYFNLAAGGPAAGHRWLLDSNFDWGQDLYRLPAALTELGVTEPVYLLYFGHVDPSLYGLDFRIPPREQTPGVIAASVTYLKGFAYPAPGLHRNPAVRVKRDHLDWLAKRQPIARLGSIWIFDTRDPGP